MIYIHDGSYEGFLTAVFDCYKDSDALIYPPYFQVPPMLDSVYVKTDPIKSNRLQNGIQIKQGKLVLKDIYLIYLSDTADSGTIALKYLRFCFKQGRGARSLRYEPAVKAALTLREKVAREWDRMLGLVRFDKTENGTYISSISPDFNILPLIAGHFAERLPNQNFMIRDTSRGTAVLCHKGVWVITELSPDVEFDFSADDFRLMWKDYWKTMAIEQRRNPRLQRQYMPTRYWKNLTETN